MAVSRTKEKISFHTGSRLQIKEKFHVYDDITIAAYSNNGANNGERNIALCQAIVCQSYAETDRNWKTYGIFKLHLTFK